MTVPFQLRRPTSVEEAVDELAAGGVPYCGGTELVAVLRLGLVQPEVLVDLKRVEGLDRIAEGDGEVVIGARVRHDEVEGDSVMRRHAHVLAVATSRLGNARVRATGTLAGNICFAEPRSDVMTALLALQAEVDLRSAEGTRRVALDEFVEGAFTTVREETELLESIRIPKRTARSTYLRFQPAEYPTVTVALVDDDAGCRAVVGAVGERPDLFSYGGLDDVQPEQIAAAVDVTEDLNGSEDYKRHLTRVFVERALAGMRREAVS